MFYCGKEVRLDMEDGKEVITISQRSFVDGRLEEIEIHQGHKKQPELEATHRLKPLIIGALLAACSC